MTCARSPWRRVLALAWLGGLAAATWTGCSVESGVIPLDSNSDNSADSPIDGLDGLPSAEPTDQPTSTDESSDPANADADPASADDPVSSDDSAEGDADAPPTEPDPSPSDADAPVDPSEVPPSDEPANPDPPPGDPPADDVTDGAEVVVDPPPPPPADDPPPAEDPPPPPPEDPPPPPPPADPPANEYCAAVADWTAEWIAWEDQVLMLVNANRAAGADCGGAGTFGAAAPLAMNEELRCAARNHSMDMAVRGYFSHTSPEGEGPGDRIEAAGYEYSWWGENIAWGYPSPDAVVNGWMNSPGHCANIMRAEFTEIGVGYYSGNYWTQTFGRP